jgi:hypothetical protein
MPLRRIHHIHHQGSSRTVLIAIALSLWLTLGLISQVAFQLIG